MDDGLNIAIISALAIILTAVIGVFSTVIGIWYKDRINKKREKRAPSLQDIARYSLNIDKILFETMQIFDADRVFLARFHNGGQFINSIPIDRFSVTNEVYSDDSLINIMPKLQNIILCSQSTIMYELLLNDRYSASSITDISTNYKKYFDHDNLRSMYMFLIKDLSGTPIGFMQINFNNKEKRITNEQIAYVLENHNSLLKLMNYTKKGG